MITIRRMTEEDAGQAAVLEADNFSEPWTESAFLETLCLDYAYYYVAETDDGMEGLTQKTEEKPVKKQKRIVGVCGLRKLAGEGEITNVSVDRDYRRKGIAAALLGHTLKEGEKLGIEAFTLEVRIGNLPAISLYEKFGFMGEGVRRGFYKASTERGKECREDALIMWKR